MKDFLSSHVQDAPTPISSAGNPTQSYRNAAGEFNLNKELRRKVKSRAELGKMTKKGPSLPDVSQPEYGEGPMNTGGTEKDDATSRYFGNFSVEAKRNVFDLLKNHPDFKRKGNVNLGRVENNTREVMPHDQTKTVENGGYLIRHDLPQASQKTYGTKNR